jgi:hypothetical protein
MRRENDWQDPKDGCFKVVVGALLLFVAIIVWALS